MSGGADRRQHDSTKARRRDSTKARFVVALLLVAQLACGYRVASRNRIAPQISTIAVLPFVNETTTFEVEQILTRSFIRVLVEKSSFRVITDPSKADGILEGVISGVSVSPVTFSQGSFGSTFLVTLNARIKLREQETGEVLLNRSYLFREQYVINVIPFSLGPALDPAKGVRCFRKLYDGKA